MGRVTLAVRAKPEANRDGEHTLRIRITKDRVHSYWTISVSVAEKHFNPKASKHLKNWIRKTHPDAPSYNERILTAYKKAEAAIDFFDRQDKEYTAFQVRDYLEQGGFPDRLLTYFAAHIDARKRAAGGDLSKMRTADGYTQTLKVLRWYLRQVNHLPLSVTDEQIDNRFWLLSKFDKKDVLELKAWLDAHYADNSVSTFLSNLRQVLNRAADSGLVSLNNFPMRGVALPVKRKRVQRLQDEEIDLLASAPEIKKNRGGNTAVTPTEHARPLALLMYLAHGARLGDAIAWRVENYRIEGEQRRLFYTTGKTKKDMSVLLDEEGVAIVESYVYQADGTPKPPKAFLFPYLPANFDKLPADRQFLELRRAKIRARSQIVRLGERIGLTKRLTPHVMRHSFADMMRRAGVPLETRQESLGHSDIKTTRNYEEQFDQPAVDAVTSLYKKRRESGKNG